MARSHLAHDWCKHAVHPCHELLQKETAIFGELLLGAGMAAVPHALEPLAREFRMRNAIAPVAAISTAGVLITRTAWEYIHMIMHGEGTGLFLTPMLSPAIPDCVLYVKSDPAFEYEHRRTWCARKGSKREFLLSLSCALLVFVASLHIAIHAFSVLYSLRVRDVDVLRIRAADGTVADRQSDDKIKDLQSGCIEFAGLSSERLALLVEDGQTNIPFNLFSRQPRSNKIVEVVLPDTVLTIAPNAFEACTALLRFAVPKHVTAINAYTFNGCTSLRVVEFDADACITHIGSYAFGNCRALLSIELPSTVETIDFDAFNGCNSLLALTIPPLVKNWRTSVIAGCTALREIVFKAPSVPFLPVGVFPTRKMGNVHVFRLDFEETVSTQEAVQTFFAFDADIHPFLVHSGFRMFVQTVAAPSCAIVFSDATPDAVVDLALRCLNGVDCKVIKMIYLSPYSSAGLYAAKTFANIADLLIKSEHTHPFRPLVAAFMSHPRGARLHTFAVQLLRDTAPEALTFIRALRLSFNKWRATLALSGGTDLEVPNELWLYISTFLTRGDLQVGDQDRTSPTPSNALVGSDLP